MTVPFLLEIHYAMTGDFVADTLLVKPHGAQIAKHFVLLSYAATRHQHVVNTEKLRDNGRRQSLLRKRVWDVFLVEALRMVDGGWPLHREAAIAEVESVPFDVRGRLAAGCLPPAQTQSQLVGWIDSLCPGASIPCMWNSGGGRGLTGILL